MLNFYFHIKVIFSKKLLLKEPYFLKIAWELPQGLDKNGDFIDALGSLGFGFIEVGTCYTSCHKQGNPKPRVFRFPITKRNYSTGSVLIIKVLDYLWLEKITV